MKTLIICLVANAIAIHGVFSQGAAINTTGTAAHPSAMIDVSSTTSGALLPRMTEAERNAIGNPAEGLLIFNTSTKCFNVYKNSTWFELCGNCILPSAITALANPATLCSGSTLALNGSATGATSWSWTGPNGFTSTAQNPTIPGITTAGSGVYSLTASNACGSTAAVSTSSVTVNSVPSSPTDGTHVPYATQIEWNWNAVSGATAYKWNTVNDYGTATDNGANISCTGTGLTCNTAYSLFVWAYNTCGNAVNATILTQTTSSCPFACGNNLFVTHTAGAVAPVNKTVTYGTVSTALSGATQCWITQNLGADNQASAANDATEASAGWYWQFNRIQGYKHDGTNRTPNTAWTAPISENSNWLAGNDPCTSLLGAGWRLPTYSEWYNADLGWNNYNDTYASVLKIHAAGYIESTGSPLRDRGSFGSCWSSSQKSNTNGYNLTLNNISYSQISEDYKSYGFSARCLR